MKLMKVLDKKHKGKIYFKYRLNIPVKIVKELELQDLELKFQVDNGHLIIKKEKKSQ